MNHPRSCELNDGERVAFSLKQKVFGCTYTAVLAIPIARAITVQTVVERGFICRCIVLTGDGGPCRGLAYRIGGDDKEGGGEFHGVRPGSGLCALLGFGKVRACGGATNSLAR